MTTSTPKRKTKKQTKTKRPNWQSLSWWSARQQWRKRLNGRCHTLGPTGVDRCRASHDVAFAEWLTIKAKLDRQPQRPYVLAAQHSNDVADLFAVVAATDEERGYVELLRQRAERLQQQATDPNAPRFAVLDGPTPNRIHQTTDPSQRPQASKGLTVGEVAKQFTDFKLAQADAGKIGDGRWESIRCKVGNIVTFIGAEKSALEINDDNLERYYLWLIKNRKGTTGHQQMAMFKQFAKYCKNKKLIPPLLRADDRELSIKVSKIEIKTVSVDSLRHRLDLADERMKLYLLLMMNCGMQQRDISDIQASEVDWNQGRLIRKRSKEKDEKNVPTVDYMLWPVTFELLKKYGKRKGTVLLNRDGKELVRRRIKRVNGEPKMKVCDAVAKAYYKLMQKINGEKYAMKYIRKTSSSMLDEHENYGRFAQYFLGHSPTSVADIHYIKPSATQFDKAVVWLGQQYGLI